MNDEYIVAMADVMAPFVRECVAEAFKVPPELAKQIASAVRMLHESPPIEERSEPSPSPPKVTRIERDEQGNFVPVYD